ncbi:MAG: DNA-binding protein [Pedobacter sp.]|nr:MAG: DNA-binding protein [Pedobacter sp.]
MTAIDLVTRPELERFKAEIVIEIKKILLSERRPVVKLWMRSADVRKLLGISAGTLQNLRTNGTLHYSKIGGSMFYRTEDVEKMMNDGSTDKP